MKHDKILLPHSTSWDANEVMVDCEAKIDAYINYREVRLNQMLACFETDNDECVKKTRQELYDNLYGNKWLTGRLK